MEGTPSIQPKTESALVSTKEMEDMEDMEDMEEIKPAISQDLITPSNNI